MDLFKGAIYQGLQLERSQQFLTGVPLLSSPMADTLVPKGVLLWWMTNGVEKEVGTGGPGREIDACPLFSQGEWTGLSAWGRKEDIFHHS